MFESTSRMNPVSLQGDPCELIDLFAAVFPSIVQRIEDRSHWFGCLVSDPDNGFVYERLNCCFQLSASSGRVYQTGINLFQKRESGTAWHNHRFPFLVFPIDLGGEAGAPLYEMDWTDSETGESGVMNVVSGECYAIERCLSVYHRVRSLRDHLSINIADVTEPAARPNNTVAETLPDDRVYEILAQLECALESDVCQPPLPPLEQRLMAALQ